MSETGKKSNWSRLIEAFGLERKSNSPSADPAVEATPPSAEPAPPAPSVVTTVPVTAATPPASATPPVYDALGVGGQAKHERSQPKAKADWVDLAASLGLQVPPKRPTPPPSDPTPAPSVDAAASTPAPAESTPRDEVSEPVREQRDGDRPQRDQGRGGEARGDRGGSDRGGRGERGGRDRGGRGERSRGNDGGRAEGGRGDGGRGQGSRGERGQRGDNRGRDDNRGRGDSRTEREPVARDTVDRDDIREDVPSSERSTGERAPARGERGEDRSRGRDRDRGRGQRRDNPPRRESQSRRDESARRDEPPRRDLDSAANERDRWDDDEDLITPSEIVDELVVDIETDDDLPSSERGERTRDDQPSDKRRRRRRRRGRRGGEESRGESEGRAPREPRDDDSPLAFDDSRSALDESSLDDLIPDGPRLETDSLTGETREVGDESAADEADRKRRRRRRRGGRGRRDRTDRTEERPDARGVSTVDGAGGELDEPVDLDSVEDEPEVRDDHDSHEGDDDGNSRGGFRGIPSWDETIGMIVAANMENRARNPQSGGNRGRGRGGRDRGGRDRGRGRGGNRPQGS
ncbi:MAG: hypothetical protein JNM18_24600 [Planctomycetaceae bacterium]|nr:hypothetical protein [Planctomycetaceae bacterium]